MYKALTAAKSKCPPTKSKRPNFGPPQNGCRRPSTSALSPHGGLDKAGRGTKAEKDRVRESWGRVRGRERQKTEIDRRQSQSQREREAN